jgi:tripeptidyl-peptidase I
MSVGTTQVNLGAPVSTPESACVQVIYSGSGFSNMFVLPAWHRSVGGLWRKTVWAGSPRTRYNSTGGSRGYPDLAANGCVSLVFLRWVLWVLMCFVLRRANYVVAVDGSFYLVYWTSVSTPVVVSI